MKANGRKSRSNRYLLSSKSPSLSRCSETAGRKDHGPDPRSGNRRFQPARPAWAGQRDGSRLNPSNFRRPAPARESHSGARARAGRVCFGRLPPRMRQVRPLPPAAPQLSESAVRRAPTRVCSLPGPCAKSRPAPRCGAGVARRDRAQSACCVGPGQTCWLQRFSETARPASARRAALPQNLNKSPCSARAAATSSVTA